MRTLSAPPSAVTTALASNGDCLGHVLARGPDRDAQASAGAVLAGVRLAIEDVHGEVRWHPARTS